MQRLVKFPFLFLFIAGCIGVLFRWHFVSPFPWLKFPFWLHAHSHLMFLGWVFNLLSLAFIHEHIAESQRNKYLSLFGIIQVLLIGMLISFPWQGYDLFSIVFSTLHTIVVGILSYHFFKDTNHQVFNISLWFARISLILFFVSAIGPFSLGPIMVNSLAHTKWYYFAVYYYLHFQYNGVFTFGVFSLFFGLLQTKGVSIDTHLVKRVGYVLLLTCFPAYLSSTLWAQPGLFFNVIGLAAALMQLVALIYLFKIVRSVPVSILKNFSSTVKILLAVALLSFIVKLILQVLSAHPYFAQMAYEIRNYLMAYLHLVLLGMITSFLLAWSIEKGWVKNPGTGYCMLFVLGLVGMEVVLISTNLLAGFVISSSSLLLIFSLMILFGLAGFLKGAFQLNR